MTNRQGFTHCQWEAMGSCKTSSHSSLPLWYPPSLHQGLQWSSQGAGQQVEGGSAGRGLWCLPFNQPLYSRCHAEMFLQFREQLPSLKVCIYLYTPFKSSIMLLCRHVIITWLGAIITTSQPCINSQIYQLLEQCESDWTDAHLWSQILFSSAQQVTITLLWHHLHDDSKLLEVP